MDLVPFSKMISHAPVGDSERKRAIQGEMWW